jgi:N6-L-threonylcarbamoyladenine synthase
VVDAQVILGIETSCDETAAAVVTRDLQVRSSVVVSSIALHEQFGGVVPELAGRAQVDSIGPVVEAALADAGLDSHRPALDAVAVTCGPGLVGSLLVGVSMAKALALSWDVPLVGVNHLEGHLVAAYLERPDLERPVVTLLVSGGHTLLVVEDQPGEFRLLGSTIDDAVGEAYDKVARYLGLGYPGGPEVDRLAADGDPTAFSFPRPMRGVGLDMSFSGLKTAVVRAVDAAPHARAADVAASFQAAVVDVLAAKCERAIVQARARTLALGGGVAANVALRAAIGALAQRLGIDCALPSLAYCTDNAAMIAAAAFHRLRASGPSPLSLPADPSLALVLA